MLTFLGTRIGGEVTAWTVVSLYTAVIAVSLLLAEVGYRMIEVPSIRVGRAVASRVRSTFA